MKDNDDENVEQTPPWYKRKTGFIALSLLAILVIVSILVGVSLYHQKPPTDGATNLVSFTCCLTSSNKTFTVAAEVNLTDGMDQDEAIKVATKVFEKEAHSISEAPISFSQTASVSENGVWMISLYRVYTSTGYFEPGHSGLNTRIVRERFEATINPFDCTVVYRLFVLT